MTTIDCARNNLRIYFTRAFTSADLSTSRDVSFPLLARTHWNDIFRTQVGQHAVARKYYVNRRRLCRASVSSQSRFRRGMISFLIAPFYQIITARPRRMSWRVLFIMIMRYAARGVYIDDGFALEFLRNGNGAAET